ncbi:LysR family transcriptional regulator [Oscillibacter hominis]|uniref:LysR family transcriptional regulator n=1 Tax=Oscillibacter hominis TaxID=2763056 RepID=A0A7G9B2Y4_9FIRM|nr:LysR family transcriptional regulator [Oscillibacter hominis]QNL43915.1 LysR family transcriptional regulator [Oscillibacter hominis]
MNLLSLEYFLVAAEEMSFTKAAVRLYITQQSLSGHIKKLEEYFGCSLFDRGNPLTLTKEGLGLQQAARKILAAVADTEKEIQDIKDLRNGELSIGITRTRGNLYLPPILTKFHQEFPNIQLTIFEGNSQETETALDRAKIDLLIGYPPLSKNSMQSIPFWKEETVLVIPYQILVRYFPAEYRDILSGSRKMNLRDVRHCPVLAMDVETRLGRRFYEACGEQGFLPKVVLKAKSLSVLVPLCLNGLGIMVCPEVFLLPYRNQIGSREDGRVFLSPISDVFPPKDMCVNYLKSKYLSATARGFVRIIEQEKAQLAWNLY